MEHPKLAKLDYPMIRYARTCPFCMGEKRKGLLVCWPCFDSEGLRRGESDRQRGHLDRCETTQPLFWRKLETQGEWRAKGGN